MEVLIELIKVVLITGIGFVAITLLALAWKILRCPPQLWEEFRRTPYHKSYDIMQRIFGNDRKY